LLLSSSRQCVPVTPDDFIRFLKVELPKPARSIEWIKFIKYQERRPARPWDLTFAICHTRPDYQARRQLFELGPKIVEATGWYPLVMGRRIRDWRGLPMPQIRRLGSLRRMLNSVRFGEIFGVRARGRSGTSILVQFTHGMMLFDFGFRCNLSGEPTPRGRPSRNLRQHLDRQGSTSRSSGFPWLIAVMIHAWR
jgi:hypothetical protein